MFIFFLDRAAKQTRQSVVQRAKLQARPTESNVTAKVGNNPHT